MILLCVRWYVAYSLNLRNLEEMMAERGLEGFHIRIGSIWHPYRDTTQSRGARLLVRLDEFIGYLENNRRFIVNYGDRYRHGEPITSSFVESAVNEVVSKHFVKRQQMAWRPAHAQGLLQVRTAVLNEQLRSCFERWYPTLASNEHAHDIAA